ncbi:MAG: reverse transcriptase domain-containing protein [Dehalococcoidales bacterium]
MSTELSISEEEMRRQFHALLGMEDVATLLDVKNSNLVYHLYKCPIGSKYVTFAIPKRSGGTRTITAPISSIKIIQKKANQVLLAVYKRRKPVHSYVRKRNIISNARRHINKRWVLNIDLEDFFPTISFQRIRGMLINKPYRIGEAAGTVIAQLCCYNGNLPQGAPTSPIISNMICSKLDNELNRLAEDNYCIYTRYSDDLTFSTDLQEFPAEMARLNEDGKSIVGDELNRVISDNWFVINSDKVKLRRYDMRQEVTGLTVNKKVNVRRRYVKQIRAMLHHWEKYGLDSAQNEYDARILIKKHRKPGKLAPDYKDVLYGKLCFLKDVIGENAPVFLRYYKQFQRLDLKDEYDAQKDATDAIRRGLLLEKIIGKLFKINGFEVVDSFRRRSGAEQIDGACKFDGCYYLIECKWQAELSSTGDIDAFSKKVERSGTNTRGLFISINGWSDYVVSLLRADPATNIALVNGNDIEHVLKDRVDLYELIKEKDRNLSIYAEPYFDAVHLL